MRDKRQTDAITNMTVEDIKTNIVKYTVKEDRHKTLHQYDTKLTLVYCINQIVARTKNR